MSTTTTSTLSDRVFEILREIAPDGYTDPESGGYVALGEYHSRRIANAIGDHEDEISSLDLNGMSNLAIGQQVCQWAGNSWHEDAKRGLGAALKVVAERLKVETPAPIEGFAKGDRVVLTSTRYTGHGWMNEGSVGVVTTVEECEGNSWHYTARPEDGAILVRRENQTTQSVHRYRPEMLTAAPAQDTAIEEVVEAWFAQDRVGPWWPTSWGEGYREQMVKALEHLVANWNVRLGAAETLRDWASIPDATARGRRFVEAWRAGNDEHTWAEPDFMRWGQYLKDTVLAVLGDVPPSEQVRASFPDIDQMDSETRANLGCHTGFIEKVKGWCTDGVDDIASGVDEQMEALNEKFGDDALTDSCRSHGGTKEWIGEVMKHKRHLLRLKVETPEVISSEATPDEVAELRSEVAGLTRRLTAVERKYQGEIREVFAALKKEANDRSWCSEYEDFLDKVDGIVSIDLDEFRRDQEWEVSWEETYTVTVRRSRTILAGSAEDAEEEAREDTGDLGIYDLYSMSADVSFEGADEFETDRA